MNCTFTLQLHSKHPLRHPMEWQSDRCAYLDLSYDLLISRHAVDRPLSSVNLDQEPGRAGARNLFRGYLLQRKRQTMRQWINERRFSSARFDVYETDV